MKRNALNDRYGFFFWLRWILWFSGSFVLSALAWTAAMKAAFGVIAGPELTMTWIVAVFGSWFLLVIPFMRKKEQIWKRLNDDQEKAVDIWFVGMGLFIAFLAASAFFWSYWLKDSILLEGMNPVWAKATFGTWLAGLVPFLIGMYRQADKLFAAAHARQTYTPGYRTAEVEGAARTLPNALRARLKNFPETLPNGHVVTAVLKSGERVPHVFILKRREILGVYDRPSLGFHASDLADLEPILSENLPVYDEAKWLRLDGSPKDLS